MKYTIRNIVGCKEHTIDVKEGKGLQFDRDISVARIRKSKFQELMIVTVRGRFKIDKREGYVSVRAIQEAKKCR